MPRGRPKKIPRAPYTASKQRVMGILADALQTTCAIPGCHSKFHLDEAEEVYDLLLAGNLLKDG